MKMISEILAEFRKTPGLMNKDDILILKQFLENLKIDLEIFSQIPEYQGTSIAEVKRYIEKADWYVDFFTKKDN